MADRVTIVGQILDTDIVNRYTLQDESLMIPIIQQETFGRSTDYIEYFVFDLGGNVLNSDYNYTSYKLPSNNAYSQSLLPNLEIDPIQDLQNLGYESGEVTTRYNFFRKLSGEPFSNQLFIQQISTDRTEIRVNSTVLLGEQLLTITTDFVTKQAEVPYYYSVILNFGNNNQVIAVNAASDIDENGNASILFKLSAPLPNNLDLKDTFWIVEEIINPYIFDINLDKLIAPLPQPVLKGPNFDIDLEIKNVVPTAYSNYNQLVSSFTGSSYQAVLNSLVNQQTNINIDYSILNEFVHYSSAENRISNFVYKIGEIETYQSEIDTNTPLTASNPSLTNSVNRASSSINTIISAFDGFETYLYFNSSSLTSSIVEYTLETGSYFQYNIAPYPKSNSTQPYISYSSASATAQSWYATASNVAVAFDSDNKDILLDTIPSYIVEDPDNYLPYITFVNMIGQYFDNIWVYIDKLTDVWDNDNNLNKGISEDLVYDWLQSFGVKLYNSQGNQSVLDYNIGSFSGSVDFNGDYSPSSSFLNNVPKKDLVIESYKRIYHNLPYLFKAKGSHGGLQGLINIFGITGSILPIKEYGGTNDYQDLKGYNPDKITLGSNNITGSILSPIKRLETSTTSSRAVTSQDLHFVDVSFSPQTQIDTAVSASITAVDPTWILDQYIGDPTALALETYPSLSYERDYWFGQTFDNSFDYGGFIRLIQFFDNSLFKMIKDFTPARGNTWTGVSIKSPVLERPKVAQYNPNFTNVSELDAEYTGAAILPIYDPYYYYLAGDKEPYYEGNISGSFIDTYAYFQEQNVNPFLVNNTIGYVPPGFVSGNTDFILDTDAPRYENFFLNSDFNALQNNVNESLTSQYRKLVTPLLTVDSLGRVYASSSVTESVQLQDSYLSLQSYTNPRYDGVQLFSRLFNTWSIGDTSYGQSPVIDYNVSKLGLFTEVTANPYLPYKSNVNIKYLVDPAGKLTELNKRNRNWEEVQNTFETGDPLNISLFDPLQYGNQVQTNGNKLIHESGYSYFPVFYAYGSESINNVAASSSWTASAVFNSPLGDSQNVLDRFFNIPVITGSIVPAGAPFLSSSFTSASAVNMFEVWDFFNTTGSGVLEGTSFFTGSGPGSAISDVTSSYYEIPAEGNYQFSYDFTLAVSGSNGQSFTGSMELWVSSSATSNFTRIDQNRIATSFLAGGYNAYRRSIPTGYTSIDFERRTEYVDKVLDNGENLYEFNLLTSPNPIATTILTSERTYVAYEIFGTQTLPYSSFNYATQFESDATYRSSLGIVYVQDTVVPTGVNYPSLQFYSGISRLFGGSNKTDILFRRTVNIDTNELSPLANPGDKVVFRLFVDTNTTGITFVSSSVEGSLKVVPSNNSIVVDNISICVNQTENAFYLNSALSPFFGPAYFFNPLDGNVINAYSTLYESYGDILYPFILEPNDKIVIQVLNNTGVILEYTVREVFFGGDGLAYIRTTEDIDGYFGDLCGKYYKILFLKRIIDETNIIINYAKQDGKTSYGFAIPQNIRPGVIDNIDNIARALNRQLNNPNISAFEATGIFQGDVVVEGSINATSDITAFS